MLGKCKECDSKVGFIKLHDGICNSCLEKNNNYIGKFKRLSKSMPVLIWLFPLSIIMQIASPWIFQALASASPEVAVATKSPDFSEQLIFSIIMLIILFVPLLISFIIRFFVARRCLNLVLAWIILIALFILPLGIVSMLQGGGTPSVISLLFLVFAFKTLRLKNIAVNKAIIKSTEIERT